MGLMVGETGHRQILINRLLERIVERDLSDKDLAIILRCPPNNISWLKNEKYWRLVPIAVRTNLEEWLNDGVIKNKIMEDKKSVYIKKPYEVEKGIPLPSLSEIMLNMYPLASMEIGDSFKVPILLGEDPKRVYSRVNGAAAKYRKSHPDTKFALRTLLKEECIRCWRIK